MTLVFFQHLGAKNLSQFAPSIAAKKVHLPQPIARGHVALCEVKIFVVLCLDVGYAAFIATHSYGCSQTRGLNRFSLRSARNSLANRSGVLKRSRSSKDQNYQRK